MMKMIHEVIKLQRGGSVIVTEAEGMRDSLTDYGLHSWNHPISYQEGNADSEVTRCLLTLDNYSFFIVCGVTSSSCHK